MATIIIQARRESTRFPDKILKEISPGKSVLEFMVERVCTHADGEVNLSNTVIIASPNTPKNRRMRDKYFPRFMIYPVEWNLFYGNEDDLMARLYSQPRTDDEIIVDLTSDCPFVLREHINWAVAAVDHGADYAANIALKYEDRTFPDGLDVQAYRLGTLRKIDSKITGGARQNTGFNILRLADFGGIHIVGSFHKAIRDGRKYGKLALTLDTPADLKVIRAFAKLPNSTWREIRKSIADNPEIFAANKDVKRKAPGE